MTKYGKFGRPVVAALILGSAALSMNSANATNGFLAYCQGANNCGMGGAGVALPQDSVSAAINPALISRVDSQFFISPGWFHPVRDLNQTDGVPNPNAQVNTLLNEDSQRENFMDFSGGINYAVTPTITLGVATYGSGGMSTKYSAARVGSGAGVGAPNPGDSQVLYRLLHIVPTVAW